MDERYMKIALDLAIKGIYGVRPNPMVGAVIVKDGRIIGEGYHEKYGGYHAEVNAFNNTKESTAGASMYVTLEPCSHFGKTPPCADLIIKNKIKKVFIGMLDPNPLVLGRGVDKLKKAGIEVEVGILEKECRKLNEVFIKNITEKAPFVIQKWAMSLDGKIATTTGKSKWISNKASREEVHKLRNEVDGIMIGIGTVLKDDPILTSRVEPFKNPVRIILDSNLRIPMDSKIVQSADRIKTIIATTGKADKEKVIELKNKGLIVLICDEKDNKVNLIKLMKQLYEHNIYSILLEGGGTLNYFALEEGIVDKLLVYISPMILGGEKSITPVSGGGFKEISEAVKLKDLQYKNIEGDLQIEGYVARD